MASYFRNLNYTMGDEDASPEMHILPEGRKHVLAVADCGSRIIPLLTKKPKQMTCVDINQEQLAVSEMRVALLQHCDLESYKGFLGYELTMLPQQRKKIFEQLDISADRKQLLKEMFEDIEWGSILYFGKFEKMLQTISRFLRFLVGRSAINIFSSKDMDAQQNYYYKHFPHFRWMLLIALLGNSTALNSLLYKGEFPKKNIRGSHFSIYKNIFQRLLTERSVKNSFFLQMIFFGKIEYADGYLIECQPEIFSQAKKALKNCKIKFVHGDIFETISKIKQVDFVSLSDVPSFITSPARDYLQQMKSGLAKGAIIVVRAHLRVIAPKIEGFLDVSSKYVEQTKDETTQLWSFQTYLYQ